MMVVFGVLTDPFFLLPFPTIFAHSCLNIIPELAFYTCNKLYLTHFLMHMSVLSACVYVYHFVHAVS